MKAYLTKADDYNRKQYLKYQQAVAEWQPNRGGFPYVGFYMYYDSRGNRRMTGWVLESIGYDRSHWFKTKKEAWAEYMAWEQEDWA